MLTARKKSEFGQFKRYVFMRQKEQHDLFWNVFEHGAQFARFDDIRFVDDIVAKNRVIAPTERETLQFVAAMFERGNEKLAVLRRNHRRVVFHANPRFIAF